MDDDLYEDHDMFCGRRGFKFVPKPYQFEPEPGDHYNRGSSDYSDSECSEDEEWRECKLPVSPLKKSYYHGACAEHLSGKTIGEVLDDDASLYPDRIAFRTHDPKAQITTGELKQKADNVAKSLLAANLKRGDMVFADGVAYIDFFALYFGALQVGMVFMAPIIEKPAELFVPKLCKMNPKAVFLGCKHYPESLPIYKQYAESCKSSDVKLVFVNTNEESGTKYDGFLQLKDFLTDGLTVTDEAFEQAKQHVSIDDTAVIFPSSGTSRAESKMACVSHHTLINVAKFCTPKKYPGDKVDVSSRGIVGFLSSCIDDVGVVVSPLRCLYNKEIGVMAPPTLTASPEAATIFMKFVEEETITNHAGLPFELIHAMNSPQRDKYNISSLKGGNLLGQALSTEVKASLMKLFPDCVNMFGATEAVAGLSTRLIYSTEEQRLLTIGMPYPHCEVKLVNDKDRIVPVGEQGEICVRGWPVFKEYFNNPSLTAEAKSLEKNGWYHYGDIGIMDETAHVTYIGRKSDCVRFKHYGDIVYPVRILAVVDKDSRIQTAKVVGIPSDTRGDDIFLFVQPTTGCSITEKELQAIMTGELLENQCPDYYCIIEEFPRVGARRKIDVNKLKEMAKSKLTEINGGPRPKTGCSITEKQLQIIMTGELSENMCPDYYCIIEEFSRVGARRKIDVNELKETAQSKLKDINGGPKTGCSITEKELQGLMTRKLLENICPDYYCVIEEFPRVGARRKIDVYKLKEIAQ